MPVLIDKKDDQLIEYDATYIDSKSFGTLNSPLVGKIIRTLTTGPMCAIDIARKLEEAEHKIYYHLNKLNRAGLIKLVGTEKRYGMVAQMYDIISPVIAAKIHDNGRVIERKKSHGSETMKFFEPFITNGKLTAKIIIGDPYPHGKYGKAATDTPYAYDLMLFMGTMLNSIDLPLCKIDTESKELDLQDNLILIGNLTNNMIIEKVNNYLPVQFVVDEEVTVKSKKTNNVYKDPHIGIVCKIDNPFSIGKKILVLGGIRSRGTRASVVAIIKNLPDLIKDMKDDGNFARIVDGLDRDGDKLIDDINILE